ncbi:MAG: hypothetical protein QOE54_219, partial [Streptosporangiaceae bacterium]|nr:hypothetical protein [Streptosporangiaceae bacterium]
MLTKPFAAWRIFLHPAQRRVAYRPSYAGSAQVSGGPGTGKTVVALHRVKHLLGRSQDSRILLTTYTNALAESLRESHALLIEDPELLARVDVMTVNAVARQIVQDHGPVPQLVSDGDADTRKRWQRIVRRLDLAWTEQFLALEFRHVVLGDLVAIAVFDQGGPNEPVAVEADELAESGRGLRTVSLTAESWGWFGNSGGRTVVAV